MNQNRALISGVVSRAFLKFGYDQRHPDYPVHVGRLLISLYSSPHRHYHNLDHLVDVVQRCEELILAEECVAPEEIIIAALFHDAIYNPDNCSDCVSQSAEFAYVVALGGGINHTAASRINALVASTGTHEPKTIDQRILCDADLAILGQEEEKYNDYSRKIKLEYPNIRNDIFLATRAHVLKEFLNKKHIFNTKTYHERYEEQARDNISREISMLEDSDKTVLGGKVL